MANRIDASSASEAAAWLQLRCSGLVVVCDVVVVVVVVVADVVVVDVDVDADVDLDVDVEGVDGPQA